MPIFADNATQIRMTSFESQRRVIPDTARVQRLVTDYSHHTVTTAESAVVAMLAGVWASDAASV
jgi:hypothetical protein